MALVGLALAAVSTAAAAEVYDGGSVGRAGRKESCKVFTQVGAPGDLCNSSGTAWRLELGWQLNRIFGIEAGHANFNDLSDQKGLGATYKRDAWDVVGIARVPVGETFYPYGKVGGYRAESKLDWGGSATSAALHVSDKNNGFTFGIGLQWDVIAHVGLRAEWQRYRRVGGSNTTTSDVDVGTLGLLWRF